VRHCLCSALMFRIDFAYYILRITFALLFACFTQSTVQLHSALFEKYRAKKLKKWVLNYLSIFIFSLFLFSSVSTDITVHFFSRLLAITSQSLSGGRVFLCGRCVIDVPIAVKSLRIRITIVSHSHCKSCAIDVQSMCIRCKVTI
jgi:hypothetical protein